MVKKKDCCASKCNSCGGSSKKAERANKERMEQNWENRMDSQEKKMSKGAQNINKTFRSRNHFGNREQDKE